MKTIFTLLFLLSGLGLIAQDGFSDIFQTTGTGTGFWNDPNDWIALLGSDDLCCGGDGIPDGDDIVIINHTITLNSNETFGYLEVNHDGTSGGVLVNFVINAGNTLTGVVGTYAGNTLIIGNGSSTRISRLTNNGTVTTTDLAITAAGTSGRGFLFVQNGGSVTIAGDISFSASTPTNAQINAGIGSGNTVNLTGSISGSGRLFGGSATQSTFNFNGTLAQEIVVSGMDATYANIEVSNSAGVTVDGDFTNTNMNGKFKVNTGATFTQSTRNHAFEDSVTNNGTWTTSGDIDTDGSFTNTGTFTSSGCNIDLAGNWSNTGTYTHTDGDTVTLDGVVAQTIAGTTDFSNLFLANTTGGATDVDFISGAITIESVLDIDDCAVANTGSSVTLLSTGTGTAQMADIGTGSYTGNLTVQRQVACTNQGFRELTSPVSGTVLDDWEDDGVVMSGFTNSDFPSFGWVSAYTYDESISGGVKNDGWVDASDASTDPTGASAGHRIYMDAATFNLSVSGTPVQGPQSISVSNGFLPATDQDGWNLIGNPYPCSVNWNLLSGTDKAAIDDIIYIWNATAGNYGSYVGGAASGTNNVDSVIAHSQAFWVHATSASGTIDFNESDKVITDKSFVRSSTTLPDNWLRVKMSSTMNTYSDEVMMSITEGSSNAYDPQRDFLKFYSDIIDEVPSLAFVTSDHKDLVMNTISESTTTVLLKAFAGASALGAYTLDFDNMEKFAPTSCVVLHDLVTGTMQDIRANPSYTYTALAGDDASPRFAIHIEVQYDVSTVEATCANSADGMIDITHNTLPGYVVSWSDDAGNVLGSATSSTANYVVTGLNPGNYLISVSGACSILDRPITIDGPDAVVADFSCCVSAEVGEPVAILNMSTGATSYTWDMGDGNIYTDVNPVHTYSSAGNYTITLTADNDNIGACSNIKTYDVEITPSSVGVEDLPTSMISAYTNDGQLTVVNENGLQIDRVQLVDLNGKLILERDINTSSNAVIDLPQLATGIFIIKVQTNEGLSSVKIKI